MFAVGHNIYTYVHDFYTLDCPPNQMCKGHSGRIVSIDWFQDDSGFCDGCNLGMVAFYDMSQQRAEQSRCKDDDFKKRNVAITSVAAVPGATNRAVVASDDRKLWDTLDQYTGFDTKYNVGHVAMSANAKVVYTGFAEEN